MTEIEKQQEQLKRKIGQFKFEKNVFGALIILCGDVYYIQETNRWVADIDGNKYHEGYGDCADDAILESIRKVLDVNGKGHLK